MKTNYSILIAALSIFTLCPAVSNAQWVKTTFPTSMPNKFFATSDGKLLVGEYGKSFSQTGEGGGLYVMSENGEKCEKADAPDNQYTTFIEDDGYVYAFSDGANIVRTSDYKTWETISYAEVYNTSDPINDCYAAAAFNGRIYCAPFGCTPVYTENQGQKWILTEPDGLDPDGDGIVYLYGMIPFKDKLYAFGVDGIYRLKEDGESWEMLQETYYASQALIFNDKLYITTDMMGAEVCLWESADGDSWRSVEISRDYNYENSIGSVCTIGNNFFIGSSKGIFYTNDNFATWNEITGDFPVDMDFGDGYYIYVKPTCLKVSGKYIYAAGFDPFGKGGIFRYDASEFMSVGGTAADNTEVMVSDNRLAVSGSEQAQITITTADGRTVLQHNGTEVQLDSLPEGLYIYSVTTQGKRYSGKFIR